MACHTISVIPRTIKYCITDRELPEKLEPVNSYQEKSSPDEKSINVSIPIYETVSWFLDEKREKIFPYDEYVAGYCLTMRALRTILNKVYLQILQNIKKKKILHYF